MKQQISGLYTIVDSSQCLDLAPGQLALIFLEGGSRLLQLRQKGDHPDEIDWNAQDILTFKKNFDFTFILNDDPELALKIGADGVHLGQDDMEVLRVREIMGPDKIIGKSTHSLDQAVAALKEPVDYISCGGIFPSPTKGADHPVLGLSLLKEIVQLSKIPVVAIGGINRTNVAEVLKTGVTSISMISALTEAENVDRETNYYVNLFQRNDGLRPL